jgi:hypothetical protein
MPTYRGLLVNVKDVIPLSPAYSCLHHEIKYHYVHNSIPHLPLSVALPVAYPSCYHPSISPTEGVHLSFYDKELRSVFERAFLVRTNVCIHIDQLLTQIHPNKICYITTHLYRDVRDMLCMLVVGKSSGASKERRLSCGRNSTLWEWRTGRKDWRR